MNTIDCSPIGCNELSSWFSRGNQVGGSETLIGDGDTDSQEGARLEPGSVLRRVQPYLHEFAGARLEKPDHAQADRTVQVMDVHPLTLLTLAYAGDDMAKVRRVLKQIEQELLSIKQRDVHG